MDAARERVLARLAEALAQVEVRDVVVVVDRLDLDAGVGEPARVVGADDGRDAGMGAGDLAVLDFVLGFAGAFAIAQG